MPLTVGLRLYIAGVVLATAVLATYLALAFDYLFNPVTALFFISLVLVAENFCVDLPRAGAVSVTFTILLAAIVLFGPSLPLFLGLFAAVVWRDISARTHPLRWAFNGCQYSLSAGLAGVTYVLAGGPVLAAGPTVAASGVSTLLIAVTLSATVFFISNTLLVSVAIGLAEEIRPWDVWAFNVKWAIPNYFALTPIGLALAHIFSTVGAVGLVLVFIALIIARQTFQMYMRLRKAYLATVASLVAALEAKDPYTRGHSERVAQLAEKIGRRLGLTEEEMENLQFAGILHDIGKIGTAGRVLRKPGRLTDEEMHRIRLHPEAGALIIKEIGFLKRAVPAVFHHHERVDGQGYVDGLRGTDIPLLARVLSVADAYDAMTSPRPYRPAMERDAACRELIRCTGGQFDGRLVDVLLDVVGYRADLNHDERDRRLQLEFDELSV